MQRDTHTWDSGVVTTPAKPGIEGVKTYTCTACKQTRTEVIPALPITYTVSYDANGGSGAPASQTKTKDVALTLSSTKPTRTGYKFLGWAASKTATSAQYQPGGSYTANAAVTLYAVWKENDYTVSYDANGGTGAPAAQTKTHGCGTDAEQHEADADGLHSSSAGRPARRQQARSISRAEATRQMLR